MRRLGAVVAALVVLGACGSRVDNWPDGALEPSDYYSTTATTLSLGGGDEPSDDGGGDEGSDAESSTATTTRRGKSSSPTEAPGELPAPAPGTYTYDETTSSPAFGGLPAQSEKQVSTERWTVERAASSVTLTQTQTDSDEDFSSTTTTTFRVRSSALEVLKTSFTFDDEPPETCTYEPPYLVLKLPLAVGTKWKTKSRCGDEESEEMEFEITGTANDVIGGKTVKTFLVRSSDSYDTTDDTTGERTTFTYTDTRHVDPATLLTVVEDVSFKIDNEETKVHRQLRSLTPS